MSDDADRDLAIARVSELAQTDAEPSIDLGEVAEIVDRHQRAQRWVASTVLAFGVVVVPNAANDHRYVVTTAGTTGTSEPTWPTGDGYSITSGDVSLVEAGIDYSTVYDIRGAVHEAWALKAAKAAEFHEGAESEIFQHCERKVTAYQTPMIA